MTLKKIFSLLLVLTLTASIHANKRYTLVIDAGHGGQDAGAVGLKSKEKNINLNVALAFGKLVEQYMPSVRVIYTRKTDVFVPLIERANIANKNKADIFISIHTNALPKGRIARGIETYTMGLRRSDEKLSAATRENAVITYESDYKEKYAGYDNSMESLIMFEYMNDENMLKSVELAKKVQKRICSESGRANKGVKQDAFLVLRETAMPACLVELGYISTPDEEDYLNTKTAITDLSRGLYQAFAEYAKEEGGISYSKLPERIKPVECADSTNIEKKDSIQTTKPVIVKSQEIKKDSTVTRSNQNSENKNKSEGGKPVFKVQIMARDKVVASNSSLLKGHKDADYYKENGMIKYTLGASTDYNEIYRLRKSLLEDFPQAFIIAFKNGEKMNINTAIAEYKNNKNK